MSTEKVHFQMKMFGIADAAERPKWSEIRETEAWRRPAR